MGSRTIALLSRYAFTKCSYKKFISKAVSTSTHNKLCDKIPQILHQFANSPISLIDTINQREYCYNECHYYNFCFAQSIFSLFIVSAGWFTDVDVDTVWALIVHHLFCTLEIGILAAIFIHHFTVIYAHIEWRNIVGVVFSPKITNMSCHLIDRTNWICFFIQNLFGNSKITYEFVNC